MKALKPVTEDYKEKSLDLVEKVFSDFYDPQEGKALRGVVKEIGSKKYYIPELDLMVVGGTGEIIGYAMFSRFHIEGRYENELLILTPTAVKTELQRHHISKNIIEYCIIKERGMGYTAVLVVENPNNYMLRDFVTSSDHGIVPGKNASCPSL